MSTLEQLRRLWNHAAWADAALLAELEVLPAVPALVLREYSHVIGAEEVWLARLESRQSKAVVWPDLPLSEVADLARATQGGYQRYLASSSEDQIARHVSYVNTAGRTFSTRIDDILLHVALHGQYHRGKLNLLLRQHGSSPVPADFIAYVRGAAAAAAASVSGRGRQVAKR